MRTANRFDDVREVNLAYLMLAQQMVREDRETAIFRLGVSEEVAQLLSDLSPGQVLKMAASDMVLCRFRFDDTLLLNLLSSHEREAGMSQLHATILATAVPVEALA